MGRSKGGGGGVFLVQKSDQRRELECLLTQPEIKLIFQGDVTPSMVSLRLACFEKCLLTI